MRNPNRIDDFCKRLAEAWKQMPNWRFGQLMSNCLGEMQSMGVDIFFPEDEKMIEWIEYYCGVKLYNPYAKNKPRDDTQ